MGTNYYAVEKKPSLRRRTFHIGKASAGWKFVFRGYQDASSDIPVILSFDTWKHILRPDGDFVIFDEYNREVSNKEFFKMVNEMQSNENKDNFTHDVNVGGYRFYFNDFG